ncbi:MAG TPA: alpha/beta hydrolase [bacterium]|nr:alpha/beta hydrolase [bacterium]
MRARYPDQEGYVERGGVRTFYEIYGNGTPTVLFLPAWAICHSRIWKAQVPYFARHYRVVTFDPRGNGRSDRPLTSQAYADTEYVQDALAVMDATRTERAVMVGLSTGGWLAALLAAHHPDRVLAAVMIGSRSPLGRPLPERAVYSFEDRLETEDGWAKHNRHYWRKDYRGFLEFFFSKVFSEPHSSKHIEDGVAWGLETTPEVLIATIEGRGVLTHLTEHPEEAVALYRSIRCSVLVIHGDQDKIVSYTHGVAIAEATGAPVVTVIGGGHHNFGRDPVKTNLVLRAFIDRVCVPQ